MFGGKLARIGAVVLAGMGATVVAGAAASIPAAALPILIVGTSADPALAIGSSGPVGIDVKVVAASSSVPFSFTVTLSSGLAVASVARGASEGDCSGVTFTGAPGSQTMVIAGTATNPYPVPDDDDCQLSFLVTGVAPGTSTASFGGLYMDSGPVSIAVSGPPITAVTPASGAGGGGTKVTLAGSGFTGATAVDFGTTPATHVKVARSGTSLTAIAPPGDGVVNVTITTPADGPGDPAMPQISYQSGEAQYTNQFTYVAPTVTSISPSTGLTAGGKKVTIRGADLLGATVTIGGTPAARVMVNKAGTSLKAQVPAGPVGPAAVVVTTPAGSATTTYTYTS
jgi:hypothetical protein